MNTVTVSFCILQQQLCHFYSTRHAERCPRSIILKFENNYNPTKAVGPAEEMRTVVRPFTCKRVDGGDTTKHICMVARRNSSRLAFKSFGSLGATVAVGEVIAICFRGLMRLFKLLEEVVRDGGGGEDEVTVVVGIKGFKLRTTLKDV
uniref:Uncharacterized protein n=1 Tax=Glossina pallidipes TaxID=7398 RepID=A0A1A9Z2X8_GLOPL